MLSSDRLEPQTRPTQNLKPALEPTPLNTTDVSSKPRIHVYVCMYVCMYVCIYIYIAYLSIYPSIYLSLSS